MASQLFNQGQLEALARAMTESSGGLTRSELSNLLRRHNLVGAAPDAPKWMQLTNALAQSQNFLKSNRAILLVVEDVANPARFINRKEIYSSFRQQLNLSLSFIGIAVREDGHLVEVKRAQTLSDAEQRAQELRGDLTARGVHSDVLKFCRAELVADDYFHAVLEATKSIAQKLRDRTGLMDDGSVLIEHVFGGDAPILIINSFSSKSERTEQSGFCNLLKGVFGMFRNPTAHEPRLLWSISKADAEDLLSLVSLIHRRIDDATMRQRV